jgi:hypothetical protein
MGKIARLIFITLTALLAVSCSAGLFYWHSLKDTPQYSLALLIDAARRDDKPAVSNLVDIDKVVDDFVQQIMDSAVEMYGRGLPPKTIANLSVVAQPIMPALKERARVELPRVIRERTEKFDYVPFAAIVMGADRYLDIQIKGDTADIKSKIEDRPLELTMKRIGDHWVVVGIHEQELSDNIARAVGQQVIAVASGGKVGDASKNLGVKDLQEVLKQAEDLLR